MSNKKIVNKQKMRKPRKNKRIITAIIAVSLAAIMAASAFIVHFITKKNRTNQNTSKPKETQTDLIPEMKGLSLDDLGVVLENTKDKETKGQYRNPSGGVDPNKVVEGNDGTLWVDEDAASNSNNVGKTTTNDQNGTLETGSDGNIYEKEPGYEIQDGNGNVVDSGEYDNTEYAPNGDPIPNGYAWDSGRNEIVPESEVGKYIYSDLTFYFEDGTVAIYKGDLVSKERYNSAKKELYTTKPTSSKETIVNHGTTAPETTAPETQAPETQAPETTAPETQAPETTVSTNTDSYGGVTNPDGTYTIYGTTYMDKATFEAFIIDESSCGYYNGIIYPISVINEMANQNTLVK